MRRNTCASIFQYLWTQDINWTHIRPSMLPKTSSNVSCTCNLHLVSKWYMFKTFSWHYDFWSHVQFFGRFYEVLQKRHNVTLCDVTLAIYPAIELQFIHKEIWVVCVMFLGRKMHSTSMKFGKTNNLHWKQNRRSFYIITIIYDSVTGSAILKSQGSW